MTTSEYPRITDISQRKTGNPRVLIVRLSAIGDCIQTMPLACAVRQHWPDAHITWVVEKASAPLVAACNAVDHVIALPKSFALSPRLLARLRNELSRHEIHFTLDPQGLTKSGLIAWLSGARRRIGFARPQAREINPWCQTDLVHSRSRGRVTQYLELLRPFGIDKLTVRFGLTIPPDAELNHADFIAKSAQGPGYVVLNPGAGWDSKRWPPDRYAQVAQHLAGRGIRPLVAWGGKLELAWATEIVHQSNAAATLAPPTTLLELAALLKHARLYVGSDTGPMHLAAAVGTPCVALFGASCAIACGPFGPGHVTLQHTLDDSPGRKRPGADNWAMRENTVQSVNSACDALLTPKKLAAA